MAQANAFVVSQFTNPSKEIVFRVSGWLDGRRVRKNFPTRAEAEAERQVLEIQRLQADSGLRPILTRLNEDQVQEAEAAFRKLKGISKSLLFYLEVFSGAFQSKQIDAHFCFKIGRRPKSAESKVMDGIRRQRLSRSRRRGGKRSRHSLDFLARQPMFCSDRPPGNYGGLNLPKNYASLRRVEAVELGGR